MAIIKCKMCGGDLNLIEVASTAECEFCGSVQTVPNLDDEKKLIQFERAERLRKQCEFDKAAGIYETIVADFRQEAEAYWGLVLCKFGIEYVDDPATGKKIPTCHRSSFDSIMEDSDFEQALENADIIARRVYRDEAKQIEEIRKGIIAVSANEEPYDIFICYKETSETGDRTLDSVLAQDVYDSLTDKGYRVFFSRISLEDKLGMEYEPYIFAALNSAKIMLAFGTDYEYFNAVWVKNEWSRFLKLMAKEKDKHLIPCFKGIDAYDMPKEFARLQAQDLGKVGASQDLLRGIEKIIPKQQKNTAQPIIAAQTTTSSTAPLLERAYMFLEDGSWGDAVTYCERVLDMDPKNAQAYVGKLMADLKVRKQEDLAKQANAFDSNTNYQKAIRFADYSLKAELEGYIAAIKQRRENERKDKEYYHWRRVIDGTIPDTLVNLQEAAKGFQAIAGWKDADELYESCRQKVENRENAIIQKKEAAYLTCIENMEKADSAARYDFVAQKFIELEPYKNSKQLAEQCKAHAERIRKKAKENEAVFFNALDVLNQAKNSTDLTQKDTLARKAIELLESIAGYSSANTFLQQAKELVLETSKKVEENERTRKENERKRAEAAEQERQRKIEEERISKEKRESAERIAMQQRGWRNAGRCQHCGGELKGFLIKKCTHCGKTKDY